MTNIQPQSSIKMIRNRIGEFIEGKYIQRFVTTIIVLNAITLGLETSKSVVAQFGNILHVFDQIVIIIFVLEIGGKLIYRDFGFFKIGWNIFDFIIVAIALIPDAGQLSVLRALRVLRTFRLLSVVPSMRKVVQALLTAVPGMMSVGAIILLIFYVSGVLATNLFGNDFDEWFGNIGRSMYSLFQIMTLESWSMGIVRPVMKIYPYAWVFFVTFILMTSFAVLNLFIGIIVDAMQSQNTEEEELIKAESEKGRDEREIMHKELVGLRQELAKVRNILEDQGNRNHR
ncbi:MAG: ion transporter [Rhodospirillales bacterium]|jgi:voltage-gated sodium channel